MPQQFIYDLDGETTPASSGNKALGLYSLQRSGFLIPRTKVCTWEAHQQYQQGKSEILSALRRELAHQVRADRRYAVRSSANVEDEGERSFAGQFASLLDVQGVDNVVSAIQQVWASADAAHLDAYRKRAASPEGPLRMAVLIQEMVTPLVSGVSFSKNPITGLDEIVVEATPGSGEGLVQQGKTPFRWVSRWGDWVQRPGQTDIDEKLIGDVVRETARIAKLYKAPLDLEWVYNGTAVYWVQVREITTVGNLNIYSNRLSREMLPGLVTPLVWSINIPTISSAWIEIFTQLVGRHDVGPADLCKAFYYQTYFNMGAIGRFFTALGLPAETLEVMLGLEGGDQRPRFRPTLKTARHLPRMLKFAVNKLRYGREIDAFLPEMDRTFARFAARPIGEMRAKALLAEIDALLTFLKKAAYANIVGPLLMQLYNGLLRANLQRLGVDYDQFNLSYHMENIEAFNPNPHLDALHARYRRLPPATQRQIAEGTYADFQAMSGDAALAPLQTAVSRFIDQFGHLSDSGNDFSKRPWREDGDMVLQMIVNHERVDHDSLMDQYKEEKEAKESYHWDSLPISRLARWRLGWHYRRARQFRYYREAISFKYTYGYGLLRDYFLTLADRLAAEGVISHREDIFYLYKGEVDGIVNGRVPADYPALIQERKAEMAAAQDVILPDIIYGDRPPPLETYNAAQERLPGVPTSGGYFRGPARIIRAVSEFGKMQPGDVLVIPFSDVSWTPLFAKAGAVVAESGGILSHSSIVAREYKVPAVVSVTGACRILQDDMPVIVDGFKGEVILHQEPASDL